MFIFFFIKKQFSYVILLLKRQGGCISWGRLFANIIMINGQQQPNYNKKKRYLKFDIIFFGFDCKQKCDKENLLLVCFFF